MELFLGHDYKKPYRDEKGRFLKGHKLLYDTTKKRSSKSKKNISKGLKKAYKEGRLKIPNYKGLQVVCIKDGNLIGVYKNSSEIGKILNISRGIIGRVCRGERKHYNGMQWFYEKDIEKWLHLIK